MTRKALAPIAFLATITASPALGLADSFSPAGTQVTVNIAATATTGRVQVRTAATSSHIRVYNSGTVPVFVACGDVAVLAVTTTSMPIGGGIAEVVGCSQQYMAAVTSTTATVYFTPGTWVK